MRKNKTTEVANINQILVPPKINPIQNELLSLKNVNTGFARKNIRKSFYPIVLLYN
jgi:hypothetical protein